jgi:LmbE family N-acetylglucosaminyl deacetylase
MAERLAPQQEALDSAYRPEQRRPKRHWARRIGSLLVVGSLLTVAVAGMLHFLAIHRSAQEIRATGLLPPELPATVLVVLARPGQELPMAGTLAALDESGVSVSILSLTRGEAQPPDLESAQGRLAGLRSAELEASADLLGVERVTTARYADGQLMSARPAQVTDTIATQIAEVEPSTVITVSNLTGEDSDSQAVAAYTLAAAQAPGSGVGRVWTMTRGQREIDWNALLGDPIAVQAPEPQVGVRIEGASAVKGDVLLAHGTQSPNLVARTYPWADRIPAQAYFRFWDREYFALAWGTPLV